MEKASTRSRLARGYLNFELCSKVLIILNQNIDRRIGSYSTPNEAHEETVSMMRLMKEKEK